MTRSISTVSGQKGTQEKREPMMNLSLIRKMLKAGENLNIPGTQIEIRYTNDGKMGIYESGQQLNVLRFSHEFTVKDHFSHLPLFKTSGVECQIKSESGEINYSMFIFLNNNSVNKAPIDVLLSKSPSAIASYYSLTPHELYGEY